MIRFTTWGLGGRTPLGGGADVRHGRFSAKMYVKTKELGPVGGRAGSATLDLPMNNRFV